MLRSFSRIPRVRLQDALKQTRSLSNVPVPPPLLLPLNNPAFKFTSVSSKIESFLAAGESYTPSQLALLPPDVRSDHQTILSVLQQTMSLQPDQRKAFLEAQDIARQAQPPGDEGRTSLDFLLSQLAVVAKTPLYSSHPFAAVRPILAQVERLGTLDAGRIVVLMETLMDTARTLEEAVEVASWVLRVVVPPVRMEGQQDIVYETIQELLCIPRRLGPRPNPTLLLQFLLSHQSQIQLSFIPEHHPFTALLEEYSRLYIIERKACNPSHSSPTPMVFAKLESLRLQHLEAVRAIHQAMWDTEEEVFTVRSCTSLMSAYNHGGAWEEMEKVWKLMRAEGGVGIDQRSVAVYFDACGFSGSLPEALSTYHTLLSTSFPLDQNDLHAYIECLTRCGAWDEVLSFLSSQQTSHTPAPPLHPGSLAATLMLANRLVKNPQHQTLTKVDRLAYGRLRAGMRDVAGEKIWEEVERLLSSRERFIEPGAKKESLMRDNRKRTELHRL